MQQEMIEETEEFSDELSPGTLLLRGQYEIESYLVRGGFGITYLARDSLERQVVIKECFPSMICCRIDGEVHSRARDQQKQFSSLLRHFLREARRLARLAHPNIVGVHQVFEENGTAYMALDYVDGLDLLSIIEEEPERLNPDLIRSMLIKSLGAISYIHDKGILHRDISPDNFLLDSVDNLTMIDFGAAREHATKENRALSALLAVKDGYSPQEFYLSDVTQAPSSDLYALGATFYHLITGTAPPHSQQRLSAVAGDTPDPYEPLLTGGWDFDAEFLAAIDKALEVFPEDRIQSAQDWVEAIDSERRRQAATTRASQDPTIQVTISKLVADANRDLKSKDEPVIKTAEHRRVKTRVPVTAHRLADPKQDQESVQRVDIFGNPIDDVDAWLRAQESSAGRSKSSSGLDGAKKKRRLTGGFLRRSMPDDPAKYDDDSQPPRFLRLLVSRLSPVTPQPE